MEEQLSITQLINGYHQQGATFVCHYCQTTISITLGVLGIERHLTQVHGGAQHALLTAIADNRLTPRQQELMLAFAAGDSDKHIAETLHLSPSTVRHQKFTFREKAKQSALYLAQYQSVFGTTRPNDHYLPIPPTMDPSDERFIITEAAYTHDIQQYGVTVNDQFTITILPRSQKKVITLLHKVIEAFQFARLYSFTEVDDQLQQIFADYGLLKRKLVDYGFLARTDDGKQYWRIF